MKVKTAIDLADNRMPGNGYETAEKCSWLTTIETMWIKFLRQLGYTAEDVSISEDESEKELLIDEPYCECYVMWLIMKMHYYNGEIELYNNSAEAFNTHFEEAQKAFIRENRVKKSHSFSSYKEV